MLNLQSSNHHYDKNLDNHNPCELLSKIIIKNNQVHHVWILGVELAAGVSGGDSSGEEMPM